jgi:hypothetical protein
MNLKNVGVGGWERKGNKGGPEMRPMVKTRAVLELSNKYE